MVDLLKEYQNKTPQKNEELTQSAEEYIRSSSSDNTTKTRQNAIKSVERHGYSFPMSPINVSNYLAKLAEKGYSHETIRSYKTTISLIHKSMETEDPVQTELVRRTMKGIANKNGVRQIKSDALSVGLVKEIVDSIPKDNKKGIRDRAAMLLGFIGAFRRSELAALNVSDIEFVNEGIIVNIAKSKTNQTGDYESKPIPYSRSREYCPIAHLKAWLNISGISEGAIFRTFGKGDKIKENRIRPEALNTMLKERVKEAKIEGRITWHSLRAGFVTEAIIQNKRRDKIKEITGHTSDRVMDGYIRDKHRFLNNAADGLL